MQSFPTYDFNLITSSSEAFNELEQHIQKIIDFVSTRDKLSPTDFTTLSTQIKLLDNLYSVTETCLKNDH